MNKASSVFEVWVYVDGICQLFMAGHIVVVLMGPYFLLATAR